MFSDCSGVECQLGVYCQHSVQGSINMGLLLLQSIAGDISVSFLCFYTNGDPHKIIDWDYWMCWSYLQLDYSLVCNNAQIPQLLNVVTRVVVGKPLVHWFQILTCSKQGHNNSSPFILLYYHQSLIIKVKAIRKHSLFGCSFCPDRKRL